MEEKSREIKVEVGELSEEKKEFDSIVPAASPRIRKNAPADSFSSDFPHSTIERMGENRNEIKVEVGELPEDAEFSWMSPSNPPVVRDEPPDNGMFRCTPCGIAFTTKEPFDMHFVAVHVKDEPNTQEEQSSSSLVFNDMNPLPTPESNAVDTAMGLEQLEQELTVSWTEEVAPEDDTSTPSCMEEIALEDNTNSEKSTSKSKSAKSRRSTSRTPTPKSKSRESVDNLEMELFGTRSWTPKSVERKTSTPKIGVSGRKTQTPKSAGRERSTPKLEFSRRKSQMLTPKSVRRSLSQNSTTPKLGTSGQKSKTPKSVEKRSSSRKNANKSSEATEDSFRMPKEDSEELSTVKKNPSKSPAFLRMPKSALKKVQISGSQKKSPAKSSSQPSTAKRALKSAVKRKVTFSPAVLVIPIPKLGKGFSLVQQQTPGTRSGLKRGSGASSLYESLPELSKYGSRYPKSPAVDGLRRLMKTPKSAKKSPKLTGVKQLVASVKKSLKSPTVQVCFYTSRA